RLRSLSTLLPLAPCSACLSAQAYPETPSGRQLVRGTGQNRDAHARAWHETWVEMSDRMIVERATHASLIDVLDRVLDKGVVIDAWVRVSLAGIDLMTLQARIFVASIETYLKQADSVARSGRIAS